MRNPEQPTGSADRPGREYRQALAAEKTGDFLRAEAWYRRALKRDPLNEALVVHAGLFYREKRKNDEQAYNLLVDAVQLNPYSVPVYQAYVRQCLAMGLTGYAEAGLETLKTIATPADYQAFLPEYRGKVALIEKQSAGFQ
ncbi:MAG: hypothetical protein H7Z75_13200 [Ferruginibacter sp.]|nr:hypothetical protein [Cytophagales bacterium]